MFNSQQIRNFLSFHLSGKALGGHFVFRRVKSVTFPKSATPVYSKYILPDEEPVAVDSRFITREELDKSVRITCSSFGGITDNRLVRSEPGDVYGKQISFSSTTYRTFDVAGLTFNLTRTEPVCPISGDLLCMWFSGDANLVSKRKYSKVPTADAWFVASDQHLRAFTAIEHDFHDSLSSIIPKNTTVHEYDSKLKEKLFCGNRLMTNAWLKNKLAHEQNGVAFDRGASIKAYYHLRTDNASKYWVDVWTALVLIARYGELPSFDNVPNTKGGEYQRTEWHLPEGFVEKLFKICEVELPNSKPDSSENSHEEDRNSHDDSDTVNFNDYFSSSRDEYYNSETTECKIWPDDPEVVKEWARAQKLYESHPGECNDTCEDVPELEAVDTCTKMCESTEPVILESKPKKRSILEISIAINWGEAEDDEDEKYSHKK